MTLEWRRYIRDATNIIIMIVDHQMKKIYTRCNRKVPRLDDQKICTLYPNFYCHFQRHCHDWTQNEYYLNCSVWNISLFYSFFKYFFCLDQCMSKNVVYNAEGFVSASSHLPDWINRQVYCALCKVVKSQPSTILTSYKWKSY